MGLQVVLPGLQALKRHALLTEQHPKPLMADVVDHPSATRKSASLVNDHAETAGRDPVVWTRSAV
jgi:hypothetical protein